MFLKFTPQKAAYRTSGVKGFVSYLEKENSGKAPGEKKMFFNQDQEEIPPSRVIREIDSNTSGLKKKDPKYYTLTIKPTRRELDHINSSTTVLKAYTREVMKEYARVFDREINGRPLTVDDVLYFAKIEHQTAYKHTDPHVVENAPFLSQIANLKKEIGKIHQGELQGNIASLTREIERMAEKAPHKIQGQVVEEGMLRPGLRTHVHVILSRKDASNTHGLSPGCSSPNYTMNIKGRVIKKGFGRDRFIGKANDAFDKLFNFDRNYVETYAAQKLFKKDPHKYYTQLNALPREEKETAFRLLEEKRTPVPGVSAALSRFALKQVKKVLDAGLRSGEMGV